MGSIITSGRSAWKSKATHLMSQEQREEEETRAPYCPSHMHLHDLQASPSVSGGEPAACMRQQAACIPEVVKGSPPPDSTGLGTMPLTQQPLKHVKIQTIQGPKPQFMR